MILQPGAELLMRIQRIQLDLRHKVLLPRKARLAIQGVMLRLRMGPKLGRICKHGFLPPLRIAMLVRALPASKVLQLLMSRSFNEPHLDRLILKGAGERNGIIKRHALAVIMNRDDDDLTQIDLAHDACLAVVQDAHTMRAVAAHDMRAVADCPVARDVSADGAHAARGLFDGGLFEGGLGGGAGRSGLASGSLSVRGAARTRSRGGGRARGGGVGWIGGGVGGSRRVIVSAAGLVRSHCACGLELAGYEGFAGK